MIQGKKIKKKATQPFIMNEMKIKQSTKSKVVGKQVGIKGRMQHVWR